MHWHRNNGAARLFGGEQNAQGAGEEASSWRDKSVGGLGRSGLVWEGRRSQKMPITRDWSLAFRLVLVLFWFCYIMLCCVVLC